MIRQDFTINMPNQPYVDDFSDGNTQAATYTGHRYLTFQYEQSTGEVKNLINAGDTMEELGAYDAPLMENHLPITIDATERPLLAAYLTGEYETGDVADYTEELGTTDADGNAETWTYYWQDGKGCLAQIYKRESVFYREVDGAMTFVGPEFRSHILSRESFLESVTNQIASIDTELAREDGIYNDEERAAIQAHKTWLEAVPTKYADVDHWKITFPQSPEFK